MRRLELDYRRPPARNRIAQWALAAAAVAFVGHTGWYYASLKEEIGAKETLLAKRGSAEREAKRQASAIPASPDEYAFARETVLRLSMPWDSLFRALEAAHIDGVALLGVEPDASQRTVTLTGEAKDYLAALSYVASLSEQKALRGVRLMRHEPQRNGGPRPLAFAISASWSEER